MKIHVYADLESNEPCILQLNKGNEGVEVGTLHLSHKSNMLFQYPQSLRDPGTRWCIDIARILEVRNTLHESVSSASVPDTIQRNLNRAHDVCEGLPRNFVVTFVGVLERGQL